MAVYSVWHSFLCNNKLSCGCLVSFFSTIFLSHEMVNANIIFIILLYPLQTCLWWGILFSCCPFRLGVCPWHFGFFLISWKCSDGYSSISADTLISVRYTYIRKCKGQGLILLELLPFVKFHNAVESLFAHCLFNQWLEFDQTSTDRSLGRGKEVIRFWWPWPYFQGHYIIKTLKVSLVCTLSHDSMDGIWPN